MIQMTNYRVSSTIPQLPTLIAPLWISSCWSVSLLECGAQNWTQYSKGALTSQRTVDPGLPLIWTWNFYQQRPSFWPGCSLCVSGAAKTQVLSAGASPQPCLCLLGSDSNCCLQRWLFIGTPFLCLTEAQCSSSERGSDASMWVTLTCYCSLREY